MVDEHLIVREISIQGNEGISADAIKAVIHTKCGYTLDRDQVLDDLRAISRTGCFDDRSVNVYPELTDGGVHLRFGVGEIGSWMRGCSIIMHTGTAIGIQRTLSHSRWPVYSKWPKLYGFWLFEHRFEPRLVEQMNSELFQFDRKFGYTYSNRFPKSPWLSRPVAAVTEKSVVFDGTFKRFVVIPTHFDSVLEPDPNIFVEVPDGLNVLINDLIIDSTDKRYGSFTVDARLVLSPQKFERRYVQYTNASGRNVLGGTRID